MITQIVLCCLIITTVVQTLEIHFIKKAIDMITDDLWYIEENDKAGGEK